MGKAKICPSDSAWSKYIRTRDNWTCQRCHKKYEPPTTALHCSHFWSRGNWSVRFDEENCQVQCPACNVFRYGEQYKFGLALDGKYGEGTAQELEYLARTTIKIGRVDYEEKIGYYKSIVKNFKKELGIE